MAARKSSSGAARLDVLPRSELAALYEEGLRAKAKRKAVEAWDAKRRRPGTR